MSLGILFFGVGLLLSLCNSQEVSIRQGIVKGRFDGNGTALYLGIPYAKAPIGDLRWQLPQPSTAWSTPFNASQFGHNCVAVKSNSSFILSFNENEDCLNINVWVPRSVYESKTKVPVMVYIHGGAFILGSSSHPMTSPDPEQFARKNSVVYVSFNYRLGPLGFLSHPSFRTHLNFGLYDQIAALQWVQDNIENFNGDSSQITVSGSSAGAISLCFLISSPLAKGLFNRVVFQSTMCDFDFDSREEALYRTIELAKVVGCKTEDIDCLKAVPADALHSALAPSRGILWTKGARWFPIIEGTPESISPQHPVYTMREENSVNQDVDVIIGHVKDEGSMFIFLGFPVLVPAEYISEMLSKAFKERYKKILDLYELDTNNDTIPDNLGLTSGFGRIASRLVSEVWECSSHRLATNLAKHGNRVHVYKFLHPPSYFAWPLSAYLGVAHGSELNYIYNSPRITLTEDDKAFASHLSDLWGWFTTHEEPYIHQEDGSGVNWPAYTGERPNTLHLLPGKEEVEPNLPSYCHVFNTLLAPNGLLVMPKAVDEPYYSWFLNVQIIKHRRLVAYSIAITTVAVFGLLYFYCWKGKAHKKVIRHVKTE